MIKETAGFPVAVFDNGLEAFADNSGIHIRRQGSNWPEAALRDRAWLRASLQMEELTARGYSQRVGAGWSLPAGRIDDAVQDGFTLPLLWSRWSEYRLRLAAVLTKRGELQLSASFLAGGRTVAVERSGRYLRRPADTSSFLLDVNTAALLDVLARLNGGPAAPAPERMRILRWLRDAGEELGAEMRGCLASGSPQGGAGSGDAGEESEGWEMPSEGLTYNDFLRLPPHLLESAVAALYQCRGFRVALLPAGNGFGAAVLARNGKMFEMAFVDIRDGGPSLDDILASESSVRAALGRSGLRSTVYCRGELSRTARDPLLRRGIEVNAGRLFAERLRSRGVNAALARTWQDYRCRTFADGVRGLLEVTC
jgi:hypothetical protein